MILAAGCEARGEFFMPQVLPVVQNAGHLEQKHP